MAIAASSLETPSQMAFAMQLTKHKPDLAAAQLTAAGALENQAVLPPATHPAEDTLAQVDSHLEAQMHDIDVNGESIQLTDAKWGTYEAQLIALFDSITAYRRIANPSEKNTSLKANQSNLDLKRATSNVNSKARALLVIAKSQVVNDQLEVSVHHFIQGLVEHFLENNSDNILVYDWPVLVSEIRIS